MDEVMQTQLSDAERIRELNKILQDYKAGKTGTERRIVESESWWKLRNTRQEQNHETMQNGYVSRSSWLHNVICNKHADAIEAYPEPNILPREQSDRQEAKILSSIIPVILEQNRFEQVYSDVAWQKMKTGTGVYKIVWDSTKLNGLGDIAIEKVNLLNIYWEPGITDIQKSRYFFHTELIDKEVLYEQYPELRDSLKSPGIVEARFLYDDTVRTDDKATLIECYYHKRVGNKSTLQYIKYCGETVLYATEQDETMGQRGLYDHGKYPYVFDALFPVEGTPCGYGYVDLCRNAQTEIDILKTACVKNAVVSATPRYFKRQDGGVNEEEFLDLSKPIVHVNGNLGEDALRQIIASSLPGNVIAVLQDTVNELRETSGNTETSTGSTSSGVTAASAIAALQEASGKGSRDATLSAYRAYSTLVEFVIELIRQFYELPRQFRIVGQMGMEQFVSYSNAGIQPQYMGNDFGVDMGYRIPVFDIKVSAQKRNIYTKVSQNELALQFFNLGFFNPAMAEQALATLDMMEFDGKDQLMQKIQRNAAVQEKLVQYMQLSIMLAQQARPDIIPQIQQDMAYVTGQAVPAGEMAKYGIQTDSTGGLQPKEHAVVANARQKSANASQPGGMA